MWGRGGYMFHVSGVCGGSQHRTADARVSAIMELMLPYGRTTAELLQLLEALDSSSPTAVPLCALWDACAPVVRCIEQGDGQYPVFQGSLSERQCTLDTLCLWHTQNLLEDVCACTFVVSRMGRYHGGITSGCLVRARRPPT